MTAICDLNDASYTRSKSHRPNSTTPTHHHPTMSRIPTVTSLTESAVIPFHLDEVWHLIKLKSIPKFWTIIESAEDVKAQEEVDVVKWKFKDGSVESVKLEEHSSIDHFITYSVVESEPPLGYSSVLSQIRLFPITSGEHRGSTFVQWSAQFSGDAGVGECSFVGLD
ncbi:polyketide cyclase/dehydrase and lipid transport domain protein [Rhizoctonia solani 123E]|uniref:Polyketide cyclase/dehydrase and lipid transport domain protein n=1 Tax=Rhizoctonia solani 123E TaxID=1423351 RepID=A0A074S143_9AGAM|nr:polyketide cyclase/dehydrase and lipid transport domain protein [Rhizoctonia solani 123E]